MNGHYITIAARELQRYLGTSFEDATEKACQSIMRHALAAAASAAASALLPDAGALIATGVGVGFVIAMYVDVCKIFGISLKKNVLKSVASVIVAETAAYLGVLISASIVFSLIPGIHLADTVLCAIINFCMVYAAGYLFMRMMLNVFKAAKEKGVAPDLSEAALRQAAKSVSTKENISRATEEGKKLYRQAKKEYGDCSDIKPESAE